MTPSFSLPPCQRMACDETGHTINNLELLITMGAGGFSNFPKYWFYSPVLTKFSDDVECPFRHIIRDQRQM